jgi:hypothetical protein
MQRRPNSADSRADHSRIEHRRGQQSTSEQRTAEHNKAEQSTSKQSRTEQRGLVRKVDRLCTNQSSGSFHAHSHTLPYLSSGQTAACLSVALMLPHTGRHKSTTQHHISPALHCFVSSNRLNSTEINSIRQHAHSQSGGGGRGGEGQD